MSAVPHVSWRKIHQCRVCGAGLSTLFCDLGAQPLANSYLPAEAKGLVEQRIPLRALVCDGCRLVQLEYLASSEAIFSDYAYLSSMSSSFVEHAGRFCRDVLRKSKPEFVVELASNDGYLLQHFVRLGVRCLGVEPAANVAALAEAKGVPSHVGFFGLSMAEILADLHGRPDLIVANNVLAHVPDVNDFVAGIAHLLAPGGRVSFEFPHLLSMVAGAQFDTIYHEHYSYFSVHALEHLLARHRLSAFDVEILPTHGGSLRVAVVHAADAKPPSEALLALRAREQAAGIEGSAFYLNFNKSVGTIIERFRHFLEKAQMRGESIAAYGAAAKGNTFLNCVGAQASYISCVADRSTFKQGRLLPGSQIPIVSPEELARLAPDFIVALPWNLSDEICATLDALGLKGRRMVTAIHELSYREIGA